MKTISIHVSVPNDTDEQAVQWAVRDCLEEQGLRLCDCCEQWWDINRMYDDMYCERCHREAVEDEAFIRQLEERRRG